MINFKISLISLIGILLLISNYSHSQDSIEKQIFIDGIILASKIQSEDYSYIETYTSENNYKLDFTESTSNFLFYNKPFKNGNIGLVVDMRESTSRIGFILVGEMFGFIIPKMKSIMNKQTENFQKIDSNVHAFFIRKGDLLYLNEESDLCETFEFISEIEISENAPIIDFYAPQCNDSNIKLEKKVLGIISELK